MTMVFGLKTARLFEVWLIQAKLYGLIVIATNHLSLQRLV
jgi:hypothetical protein